MPDTPALALPLHVPGQAQRHEKHNEALHTLDAVVQLAVKDRSLAAPPSTPAAGDRYIVTAGPTGAWSGHALDIAAWDGSAWLFHEPREGWRAWVEDEDALLIFDGAAWVDIGSAIKVLQNLSLLGVGTSADATNPFSAKLNKASWTARTAAEGGDGDLRYTMNKETAADVLSLLFQTGFSGRAELGLIGDDDLTVKVSADGSAWIEALRLTSGGRLGIGTPQPKAKLALSANSNTAPDALADTLLQIHGNNSSPAKAEITTHGGQAQIALRRSDGTAASPAGLASGAVIGSVNFFGHDGTSWVANAKGSFQFAAGGTWSPTSQPTAFAIRLTPVGATAIATVFGLSPSGDLQMGSGLDTVIDSNRHPRLRSYGVASLPSASPAGQLIYVSDGTASKRLAVSDGTNWRFPDGAVVS